MSLQIGEQHQHAESIVDGFSQSDDAAAADLEPRLARKAKGLDSVLHGAGGDDLPVEFRRGVDIVIVEIQPRFLQTPRLILAQHAQRRAGLHAKILDRADHRAHLVEIPVLGIAPCGGHAEPAGAGIPGAPRGLDHRRNVHQPGRLDAGVVVGALRAIAAILRAAAGLDAEQACDLDAVGIEVSSVDALRPEDEIRERQIVERFCLRPRPVVARLIGGVAFVVDRIQRRTHPAIPWLPACTVKFARAASRGGST